MTFPRPLAYKDVWMSQVEQTVTSDLDKDNLATFPDQTTLTTLSVEWTQVEYTRIFSALLVGAEFTYPSISKQIMYDFLRLVNGGTAMSCEDVADCIETEEIVKDAITSNFEINLSNLMQNANSGLQYPKVDAEVDTVLTLPEALGATGLAEEIKELSDCNLDVLFAGIRDGIVARLDDNARSVLEYLVSKADLGQRTTALVGAIPVFGSMAKAVLDQMVELAPDMLNLFESYSSIGNLDTIACEIFAIVCAECRYPTYDEVFTYYANAGITGMNDIDDIVVAAATDLLFGSTELASLAFYHTMIAYELFILYLGSKFYGASGTNALNIMASLGEDNPTDNWKVLCDTCNEPFVEIVYDFTQSSHNAFVNMLLGSGTDPTTRGTYVAGKGWMFTRWATGSAMRVSIMLPLDLDTGRTVRALAIKWAGDTVDAANNTLFYPNPQSSSGATTVTLSTATGDWSQCMAFGAGTSGVRGLGIAKTSALNNTSYLEKVVVLYDSDDAPTGAMPTTDTDYCE